MKLSIRFVLLTAALLLSVAASASAGWQALGHLDRALDGVVHRDMERLLAITHSRRLFRSLSVLERDYLLSSSPNERISIESKLGVVSRELEQQLAAYASTMPAGDEGTISDIRDARRRWLALSTSVREAAQTDMPRAVELAARHSEDPVSWEKAIGGLVNANEKRLAGQVEATHQTYLSARKTLLTVSALAALIAASLGYVIFQGIRANLRELSALNTNLEQLVEQRTRALAERERSLRLVLDSTGDGIVGVRKSGALAGNASASAVQWFGALPAGESAARHLFAHDTHAEASFRMGLQQLMDDVMPPEVTLDQMPQRIVRGDHMLDLSYKIVSGDDDVALLVVAHDVTARVHSEQAEQEARERQGLVGKLLLDKRGFCDFASDAERLIRSLETERDERVSRRNLHTLKGNVAVYGLLSMARICHQIEGRLAESGGLPNENEVRALAKLLRDRLKGIEDFLTGLDRNVYEVDASEHGAVVQSLLDHKDYAEVLGLVEMLAWPRTVDRLARLRGEAELLGRRLGKQIEVEIDHQQLRLPADYLARFWPTLTHVVRNAMTHGIETPEQREALGKPAKGRIVLKTWLTDERFHLQVEDDGHGIDVGAVKSAALARSIVCDTNDDAIELIFRDGLSTQSVSDLSGRGVGLAATRSACEAEGGWVEVASRPGQGASFVFSFPRPVVAHGALVTKAPQRVATTPDLGLVTSG